MNNCLAKKIVIVDYGMGNVGSVKNIIKYLGYESIVSSESTVIDQADLLILPGVGAFDQGMQQLVETGIQAGLNKKVMQQRCPILGICLGMQLLGDASEEGRTSGLGWLPMRTVKFNFAEDSKLRLPHIGWNLVCPHKNTTLFEKIHGESRFYFVHNYHVICEQTEDILTTTHYGYEFVSSVKRGHITGVQFHPEKSHQYGIAFFKHYLESWGC